MSTEKEMQNRYQEVLSLENDTETRERYSQIVEIGALVEVFNELGRHKDVRPNLAEGKTEISISAYFALEKFASNPINQAMLELIPGYSYKAGYGDTVDVQRDSSSLKRLAHTPKDPIEAARRGLGIQHTIAAKLGIIDGVRQAALLDGTSILSGRFIGEDNRSIDYWRTNELSRDLVRDVKEGIVADVSDVAALVKERQYTDLLDYILDVQQLIHQRTYILFSSGPNVDAEQLSLQSDN